MKLPDRLEIQVNTRNNFNKIKKFFLFSFVCGLLTILIYPSDFINALHLIIIGGIGFLVTSNLPRRETSIILTSDSLHLCKLYGGMTLSWDNIESIDSLKGYDIRNRFFNKALSRFKNYDDEEKLIMIKLKSHDRFINGLLPSTRNNMKKNIFYLKIFSYYTYVMPYNFPGSKFLLNLTFNRMRFLGRRNLNLIKEVRSFRKFKTISDVLVWSRDVCGYEISFGRIYLDRPTDEFIQLLEKYRCAFKNLY